MSNRTGVGDTAERYSSIDEHAVTDVIRMVTEAEIRSVLECRNFTENQAKSGAAIRSDLRRRRVAEADSGASSPIRSRPATPVHKAAFNASSSYESDNRAHIFVTKSAETARRGGFLAELSWIFQMPRIMRFTRAELPSQVAPASV